MIVFFCLFFLLLLFCYSFFSILLILLLFEFFSLFIYFFYSFMGSISMVGFSFLVILACFLVMDAVLGVSFLLLGHRFFGSKLFFLW